MNVFNKNLKLNKVLVSCLLLFDLVSCDKRKQPENDGILDSAAIDPKPNGYYYVADIADNDWEAMLTGNIDNSLTLVPKKPAKEYEKGKVLNAIKHFKAIQTNAKERKIGIFWENFYSKVWDVLHAIRDAKKPAILFLLPTFLWQRCRNATYNVLKFAVNSLVKLSRVTWVPLFVWISLVSPNLWPVAKVFFELIL